MAAIMCFKTRTLPVMGRAIGDVSDIFYNILSIIHLKA